MDSYVLSPNIKKVVGLCYKSTFFLMGAYLVFFLAIVFAVIQGWLEQKDQIVEISAYIVGSLIFVCIFTMAFYAIGYVWQLWKNGYKKEAIQGLITFIFLNILAGYIWFYWSEIKHREIRFKREC